MSAVLVRSLDGSDEADRCAEMMAASEPWLTLGRDAVTCRKLFDDVTRETLVAMRGPDLAGFLILSMVGALRGYISTICVTQALRSTGVGAQLLAAAESRIFRDSPNVFLCVSSFNARARQFYERNDYHQAGVLADYFVRGHDEILMRKTRGAWNDFAWSAR